MANTMGHPLACLTYVHTHACGAFPYPNPLTQITKVECLELIEIIQFCLKIYDL